MPVRLRSSGGSCRRIRPAAPARWPSVRKVRAPSERLLPRSQVELRGPPAACTKSYLQEPECVHPAAPKTARRPPARNLRFLEFLSRLSHGNRSIHSGEPDHRRCVAIFDAAVIVVPGLAGIIANARLATYPRVVC